MVTVWPIGIFVIGGASGAGVVGDVNIYTCGNNLVEPWEVCDQNDPNCAQNCSALLRSCHGAPPPGNFSCVGNTWVGSSPLITVPITITVDPVTINGSLQVGAPVMIQNQTVTIDGTLNVQGGSLVLSGSSVVIVSADLSLDAASHVMLQAGNGSIPIQVAGCLNFSGSLNISAATSQSIVPVATFRCSSGQFASVNVVDNNCLKATPQYTQTTLQVAFSIIIGPTCSGQILGPLSLFVSLDLIFKMG